MALHRPTFMQAHPDAVRLLAIFAAFAIVFALIVVLGAIIGVNDAPIYQIVPDPAGLGLPF